MGLRVVLWLAAGVFMAGLATGAIATQRWAPSVQVTGWTAPNEARIRAALSDHLRTIREACS